MANYLSSLLISSYLLATLANLLFTKRLFGQSFAQIQNWVGLVLVIGIITDLALRITKYLSLEGELSVGFLESRSWDEHFFLNLMIVYPLIILTINATAQLRKMLTFVPEILEFFIVYTTSNITFSKMNTV